MGLQKPYNQEPREGVHDIEMRFVTPVGSLVHQDEVDMILTYRDRFNDIAQEINAKVQDSREKSLALTNLEEAQMWLTKAILK